MNKPKFINRPEATTISGKTRKKMRSLTKEEIDYLKTAMHLRFSSLKEFSSIQWNFNCKFGWKPNIVTIKNFYNHKTYRWVWEGIEDIPVYKKETTKKQIGVYDEYKDVIIEALEDPYFGSNEQNFYEYLKVFAPKIKVTENLFFYLRKKFNVCPQSKQKTNDIINKIVKNKNLETPILYELINKDFGLTFSNFNYYCRKANIKKAITENGYKRFCLKRKEKSITIKFEMRYSIDGKFYIEEVEMPKNIINKFKNEILKNHLS